MPLNRRTLLGAGGALSVATLVGACGADVPRPPAPTPSPPSASGPSAPGDPVMDEATVAAVDAIVSEQFRATGVAGLAGAVRIGDRSWTGTRGMADLATGAVFRATDNVRIASITKTFAATAVLRLVDQQRLRLDDVLETYVPGVPNGREATIADLLGMTSGIPDFTGNDGFVRRFTENPTLPWTDQDTLDVIAESRLPDFAPGETVAYCDSNYALLGMVLEKVTGRAKDSVVTTEVIEPLGLRSTWYPRSAAVPDPHPQAYVPGGDAAVPFDNRRHPPRVVNEVNPAVPSTAGAMVSTLADLQTWGTELVTGTLLAPETHRRRLQSRRFDGQQINVGYGLGIFAINEFLGHDGAIFGYSSVVLTRPQTDTQITFVANESTNSTTPTLTVALAIISELCPDQVR